MSLLIFHFEIVIVLTFSIKMIKNFYEKLLKEKPLEMIPKYGRTEK